MPSQGKRPDSLILPPSREQMGRASWKVLHAAAAQFPDKPSKLVQRTMLSWLLGFTLFYPCHVCRDAFIPIIQFNPPSIASQKDFVLWVCRVHNAVNEDLSLPIYDCTDRRLFEQQSRG
ncbi:erv1-alr family domain-containing protein, conserved, putative [Eimeria necatrix]|uniref:Sulfhydryl oxidase n=1 Tax=Eimeria necatrix TaxID=51315 RepID=U6MMC4_9EIME|nr:erv1-alr family domain-containing protein, conserved, putative [Eimeria necatrix]CDJ64223.1 erv1-alr family domain-containing protein, conserved, putative [Eimeria necatrix]